METLKNFFTGVLVVMFASIILALGFLLWPIMLGIGSVILFVAVIVLAFILSVYVIVLIGYAVRKSLKTSAKGRSAPGKKG